MFVDVGRRHNTTDGLGDDLLYREALRYRRIRGNGCTDPMQLLNNRRRVIRDHETGEFLAIADNELETTTMTDVD